MYILTLVSSSKGLELFRNFLWLVFDFKCVCFDDCFGTFSGLLQYLFGTFSEPFLTRFSDTFRTCAEPFQNMFCKCLNLFWYFLELRRHFICDFHNFLGPGFGSYRNSFFRNFCMLHVDLFFFGFLCNVLGTVLKIFRIFLWPGSFLICFLWFFITFWFFSGLFQYFVGTLSEPFCKVSE